MASARHRRLGRSPTEIGPRRVGGSIGSISDAGNPGSWGWGQSRDVDPRVREAIPATPPGGNATQSRGWPLWQERAKNFALPGWFVPHHIWRDGMARIDISDPYRSGRGQHMAFGFVQRGYRYDMPLADYGVAQGHPTDRVLPACVPGRGGGDADLAEDLFQVGRPYRATPPSVALRDSRR